MFSFIRVDSDDDHIPTALRTAEHAYAINHNGHFIGYVADTGYAGTWKWQAYSRLGSVVAETTTRRDGANVLVTLARANGLFA